MHTLPNPADTLRRFWPALLGFGTVYALWPLLWLGLNSSALHQQEPNAGPLFAAAPTVYFTGQPKHFQEDSEDGVGGRYLLKGGDGSEIKPLLTTQGWQFTEQMGAAYIFEKDGERIEVVCHLFTRHFAVCNVS